MLRRIQSPTARWAIVATLVATAGVALVVLSGCEILTGRECERIDESWCDDGVLQYCQDQDDGIHGRGTNLISTVCDDGETCREWGDGEASCVSDVACEDNTAFCVGHSLVVCPEGDGPPDIHLCGEDGAAVEGSFCVEYGTRAACAYEEEVCSIFDGSRCEKDWGIYYHTCVSGFWSQRDSCLYGEQCIQLSDTEVGCFLSQNPSSVMRDRGMR